MDAQLKTADVTGASVGTMTGHRVGEVRKSPMLSPEMELTPSRRWRDRHDISADHQLTGSYRRLLVMIAMDYRAHGVASEEMISEGCVGLMRAVCRFDPDRGIRFGTYAVWWVRATVRRIHPTRHVAGEERHDCVPEEVVLRSSTYARPFAELRRRHTKIRACQQP